MTFHNAPREEWPYLQLTQVAYNKAVPTNDQLLERLDMEMKTVTVPGIGCNGCVNAIEGELGEMSGVQSVKADLDSKQVVVEWNSDTNWNAIRAKLVEIEYPPAE